MKKTAIALSVLLLVTHLGYGQKQKKEPTQQPLPVRQKHFSDSIENYYQFEKVSFDQLNNAKILRLTTPKRFSSFNEFCASFQTLHPLLERIGKSYAASVLQNPDIEVYVYYETNTRLGAFQL